MPRNAIKACGHFMREICEKCPCNVCMGIQCQRKETRRSHMQHRPCIVDDAAEMKIPADVENDAPSTPEHQPPPAVDEVNEDEGSDSVEDDVDVPTMLERLSRDVLAVPSETNASEQTIVRMCQIFAHRLSQVLSPLNIALPDSMYMLRKTAGEEARPNISKKAELWPFCPCLRHIFNPNLAGRRTCPSCGQAAPSVTDPDVVKAAVFDVVGRLQALMAIKKFAQCFHYAANRDIRLNDGDVWGADLLRDTTPAYRASTFVLRVTADATVSQSFMNKSTIPYVALVLNYHPRLRSALGALLPFFAMPKTKSLNNVFARVTTAVLSHFGEYFRTFRGVPGAGFLVYDAYLQVTKRMYLEIVFGVEDIRGLPTQLNSSTAPNIAGSCQRCKVQGLALAKQSTVYFGAITYRPRNDPRRAAFRDYWASLEHDNSRSAVFIIEHLTRLASAQPAAKVTTAWSKTAEARISRIKSRKPSFHGGCLYEECFPAMDFVECFAADPAHEFGNLWIRLANLIANKGQNKITLVRWAKESNKLGRFKQYEYNSTNAL